MSKEKQLIRFDWAIKRLLRDKGNPVVLEGFLTSLLGKEIKIIDFLESEGNKHRAEEKSNRIDIVAKDDKGARILIEVQNETEDDYFHRILFGTSRMIIDHVKQGEKYDKVPKVYSINIVYFDLGDKSDYVYHGFTEFKGLHNGAQLQLRDKMKKRFEVELPGEILPEYYILLANDFDKWSKVPLDQWMYYLSTSTIPADADAPGLQEAKRQLDIDNLSEEERIAYYKHLDNMRSLVSVVESAYTDGEFDGLNRGRAEGRDEQNRQNAINFYKLGVNINIISKATGISIIDLRDILKEIDPDMK